MTQEEKINGTLTREEEIKIACKDYMDNGGMLQSNLWFAFKAGAEWADANPIKVWHDASERPVKREDILLIGEHDYASVCFFSSALDNPDRWEKYVKDESLTQWAYVSDLLPKGEK